MAKREIEIREMRIEDQDFITEMLYQAIHVKEGDMAPSRNVLEEPKLKKYYANIGKSTDVGYIAYDKKTRENIGAIWLRLFLNENRGWGYVADNIPELSMAVCNEYRGMKIGTLLIEHLLEKTIEIYPSISLSVDSTNKALALYKRYGFKEIGKDNDSITMLLKR